MISPEKNLWHCLGACQAGGTVIGWVMKAERVSLRHAVELLREVLPALAVGSGSKPASAAPRGTPLWQAEVSGTTWQFHYFQTDHLGTPKLATNAQGQRTWQAKAEAFGQTILDPNSTLTVNLRFPGQYYDQESGLHYNYYRDYDPATGRYIQSDPIGLEGGINTYGYAGQNPLVSTLSKEVVYLLEDSRCGGSG